MFERYTEKARRVIFFARYEVSELGAKSIETEHLLLGLLREDKALILRFLSAKASVDEIRKQVEEGAERGTEISTSVEVPLSGESKKVLKYATNESENLGCRDVRTEHLLIGLLRMKNSLAERVLRESGVHLSDVRRHFRGEK